MAIPGLGAAKAMVSIKTKGGDFLVLGMTGHEHLGHMFEYTVELAGALDMMNDPKDVNLQKLLGTRATVKMDVTDDARYFDGYVTRASRGQKRGRYLTYSITLQPWLWFLTRTKKSRVFQDKSVKDIVTAVLADYSIDSAWRLVSASVYPEAGLLRPAQRDRLQLRQPPARRGRDLLFLRARRRNPHHGSDRLDGQAQEPRQQRRDHLEQYPLSVPTMVGWHVQQEARSVKATLTEYDYLAPATKIKGEKKADPPPAAGGLGGLLGAAGGGWTSSATPSGTNIPRWSCRTAPSPTRNRLQAPRRSVPRSAWRSFSPSIPPAPVRRMRAT